MTKSLLKTEVAAALTIVTLGIVVIIMATDFSIGTLKRMGPGYFPIVLGSVLSLIGLGLVFEQRKKISPKFYFPVRPFVALSIGILAFAFLIEETGLVPAVISLVVLSSLGRRPFLIKETLMISAFMSVLGVVVFIVGLGIPLNIFW